MSGYCFPATKPVSVVVVYIHVLFSVPYFKLAERFVEGYCKLPPHYPHRTVIVCNMGAPTADTKALFSPIPQCEFLEHDNSGYDIGGYQHAARDFPCDLMVFFGASTYFKRAGWLERMVEAFQKHGRGLYGAMGHSGVPEKRVWPHIRTTAFWMPPDLLNEYPHKVTRPEQRYPSEHGKECISEWVKKKGLPVLVVSWSGVHRQDEWNSIPNGYHQGNQSSMLAGDHLTMPPYFRTP